MFEKKSWAGLTPLARLARAVSGGFGWLQVASGGSGSRRKVTKMHLVPTNNHLKPLVAPNTLHHHDFGVNLNATKTNLRC